MKWRPGEPAPGDMVRVQIGSIFHYGIYAGDDRIIAFGLPPVPQYADAPDRFLVVETDMDVFCVGRIPEIAILDRAERKKRIPPDKTVRLAKERLGTDGYHLIRNNCEHFAYECVFGEKKSEQEEAVFRMWNARPVLNVYLGEADRFTLDFPVPPEREREINACSDPAMRQARIANWALLRRAAKHCFSLDADELRFVRQKNGGWSCDRFPFSFSHADGLCCVAVSNAPVGVDLETLEGFSRRSAAEKLDKLRKRCFSAAEQSAYPETVEGFLACWTRKEAIFKASKKRAFFPAGTDSLTDSVVTFQLSEPRAPIVSVFGPNTAFTRFFVADENGIRPIGGEPMKF
ncbi:MAG: lecithin retinol acyltransferase family protein [Clostridia bacterium]|nr:lecithin retinol acyltransferase family protein [Clostridia bacterium]